MVDNIIEKIKESEEKAKEIINLSRKESAEIVEKAYSKSKEILEETKKEISDMISKYETKAKADAKKEIEVLKENFDKDLNNIKKVASHKEEEAANKIIQRISN
jgi:vacuolar-type H+-ATPase subunit H